MQRTSDLPDVYLDVRRKEGRLYSDAVVSQLPSVPADHPLRREWSARSASCDRIALYLAELGRPIQVLDLGCGNGWLANRLARAAQVSVVGLDRNRFELDQARRVFSDRSDLSWIASDVFNAPFPIRSFDVVLIASTIQYFADMSQLIGILRPLLAASGEIHILDSPFYSPEQLPAARERSRKYYDDLGFPEMAGLYHHHSTTALEPFRPIQLYTPRANQGPRADSPFPWLCLRPDG